MMMHVLRPVRASASRLLATPTGTNSTVDYQQPPAFAPTDSGGSCVAVQQPSPASFQSSAANFNDCSWSNGQCANLPVIWPMHSVFNAPSSPQGDEHDGGINISADHNSTALMASANPYDSNPQATNGSMVGATIWLQPVLWPVFRPCEGFSQMEMGSFNTLPDGAYTLPVESCQGQEEFSSQFDSSHAYVVAADTSTAVESGEGPSFGQQAEKPQSGARRQRRSKRGGVSVKAKTSNVTHGTAALCDAEVEELRRAVKTTEEGFRLQTVSSERRAPAPGPSAVVDKVEKVPSLTISWADMCDEDEVQPVLQKQQQQPQPQFAMLPTLLDNTVHAECHQKVERGTVARSPLPLKCMDMNVCEDVDDSMALQQEDEDSVEPMLLELGNADGANFRSTVDAVVASVWPLALTKKGCRIVQKTLEVGTAADQQQIVDQLQGRVQEALRSPHANHVLQKCIEIMPPAQMHFVLTELKAEGAFASRHRFGCRIVQRLIEHCDPSQTEELIVEVLADTARLSRHQYGNFVIQHILQHGSPHHRHIVAEVLCEDTIRLAKHRIASHVLSCAMIHCEAEDVKKLTKVVLHDAGQLADLSRRQYGSFVVREVNRAARQFA